MESPEQKSLRDLFSNKIGILKIKKFGKKNFTKENLLKKHKTKNKNKKMLSSSSISYKKLMKRKKFIAKHRKKLKKLDNLKKALVHRRVEQKANLISDRSLLNLINQRVITNDLFNNPQNSPQTEKSKKKSKKTPGNSIESEILYNQKTDSLIKQIKTLNDRIQELKFHQTNTKQKIEDLVDSESKRDEKCNI